MTSIKLLDWYFVFLQQDWTICQIVNVEDDIITVNFHGFLYRNGKPIYEEDVSTEHFKLAYHRSTDGDWSREYHPNTFDGIYHDES